LLETSVYVEVQAALYHRGASEPEREPSIANVWIGYILDETPGQVTTPLFGELSPNELEARDRALRYLADELVLDLFAPVN
jgi:hypothetical protein